MRGWRCVRLRKTLNTDGSLLADELNAGSKGEGNISEDFLEMTLEFRF